MPEPDRTVNCPICDEAFDPTVAGGWCTNPDCGEWQHTDDAGADSDTDDAVPDDGDLIAEGTAEGSVAESDEVDTPDGHAGDHGGDDEAPLEEAPVRETPDTGGVEDGDESGGDSDERDEPSDERDETPDVDDDAATITCPDCDRALDADANFCVDCGADVGDITPGDEGALDACPSCDTAVDDEASFCVNCGENLDAHRNGTAGATASSEPESSSADATATADALASQSTDDATVPDRLVLSVEGRDITVEDGDRIGREIRAALLDAGRPEDEAVRIHREHVRFDRQPEGYYLVDLGDNPTRLNGTPLKKGDRELVEPGDELELSGVVTVTIQAA
ncbi:double zinc ribbon domain-containing protein [Haloarcula sp. 1CSR25-25]|uniref:double zinc ribbon domain-containing protein n=1 Tax=Haloarcula sp. 1CSR25-25 TaxID=2862545 RepID=UPI002894EA48|nr:zinc ribbon domain-containing protein [Haloarcula sp. 1CSR25-25]MDT3435669.1 zinc ribbon domain-containing protein [Haloarcula sp. 1CSR25-25]